MRVIFIYIRCICFTDVNEARLHTVKGQDDFKRQLHVGAGCFGMLLLIIFLLCELIILPKLGMEL